MRLRTVCTNQRGDEVLTGEALVMPSKTRVVYVEVAAKASGALRRSGRFAPWAWITQGAAIWTMLGLSALTLGAAPSDAATNAGRCALSARM